MKILHVIPSLDVKAGGPSRSLAGLAIAQHEVGAEVSIIFGRAAGSEIVRITGSNIVSGEYFFRRFSLPGRHLLSALKSNIKNTDIVHVHCMWNGVSSIALSNAKKYKKCTILSPRGTLSDENIRQRAYLKQTTFKLFERKNIEAIRGIHFQDSSEKSQAEWISHLNTIECIFQSNGFTSPNSAQFPNVPSLSHFNEKETVNFVFLGRINSIKGIELQIDVIGKLVKSSIRCRLYIVGPDDGMRQELENYSQKMGLDKIIIFTGPINGDERLAILRDADFVLLTSHSECNSNSAMESIGMGALLVATDTCNLEIPAEQGAVALVRRDIDELHSKLIHLISNRDEQAAIRKNALVFASKHLSWTNKANEMIKFYNKLI